ncbi:MAG: TauD/TfdA family dioxygenase [Myxococcota bacterium]|nr:TauD/TfdA family dioxygenase [Myxococcota bacterium]
MLQESMLQTPGPAFVQANPPCPAWRAPDVIARGQWEISLGQEAIDEFFEEYRRGAFDSTSTSKPLIAPERTPKLKELSLSLRRKLLFGDGFARIKQAENIRLSAPQQRALFLRLGTLMGRVMTEYGQLYPVHDRGIDYKEQAAPVSMTTSETGMHTDSSAVGALPDFVGLLCEEPSLEGGDSLISNALTIYHDLKGSHPEIIDLLENNFIRDVVTPGASKSLESLLLNTFPIYSPGRHGEGSTFRYMRYWIEKGAERAGLSLKPEQYEAFNRLDEALNSPENQIKLRLDRGDILLANNRTLAHGRTGYSDRPGHRRQLQRIWVDLGR